jgi:hypothetical protein
MDQEKLQIAIDAIWKELGVDEYGCLVEVDSRAITITIAGEYKGNTYYLSDMISLLENSNSVDYTKELNKIVQAALIDIYKFQIMYDLECLSID